MKKILPYLLLLVPVVFGFIGHLDLIPVLPDSSNTWFSASGKCELCHNTHTTALRSAAGDDVSPVSQWRSTMLANASKDPFWRAKVKHEGLENSIYPAQNIGCQSCHMPRIDEAVKITSRPLFLPGRQPFGQHTFTGGNLFMLTLLKDNHDALALTSGPGFLQKTIDRTREMLINETVDLSIDAVTMRHDSVYVDVSIQNKTGHKFPTGFPSRRAQLACLITQGTDTLFHSGKKAAHALTHFDTQRFEPHHQIIRDEQQVLIYEFVMGNTLLMPSHNHFSVQMLKSGFHCITKQHQRAGFSKCLNMQHPMTILGASGICMTPRKIPL